MTHRHDVPDQNGGKILLVIKVFRAAISNRVGESTRKPHHCLFWVNKTMVWLTVVWPTLTLSEMTAGQS